MTTQESHNVTKNDLVDKIYKQHTEAVRYGVTHAMKQLYADSSSLVIGVNRISLDYCNRCLNNYIRSLITKTLCEVAGFDETDILNIESDGEYGQIYITVIIK